MAVAAPTSRIVSASADGSVRLWNLADGAAVATINHGAPLTALAVSPDGATIVSAAADNSVKIWKAADGAAIGAIAGHPAAVNGLEIGRAHV